MLRKQIYIKKLGHKNNSGTCTKKLKNSLTFPSLRQIFVKNYLISQVFPDFFKKLVFFQVFQTLYEPYLFERRTKFI